MHHAVLTWTALRSKQLSSGFQFCFAFACKFSLPRSDGVRARRRRQGFGRIETGLRDQNGMLSQDVAGRGVDQSSRKMRRSKSWKEWGLCAPARIIYRRGVRAFTAGSRHGTTRMFDGGNGSSGWSGSRARRRGRRQLARGGGGGIPMVVRKGESSAVGNGKLCRRRLMLVCLCLL